MTFLSASPSELCLLALAVLGLAVAGLVRWRCGPREPAAGPERGWLLGTGVTFVVALAFLIGYHQHADSSWTPHGADWDSWYQSAVAWRRGLALHPMVRWPLNGALAAALDLLLPGPLFQALQLVSLISAAAAAAGVYLLGHLLLGRFAGVAAAVLALLQPTCLELAQWSSAYNLWAACACWGAAGIAAASSNRRPAWWVVAGLGIAGTLASMPKGLPMGVGLLCLALVLALLYGRPRLGACGALLAPVLLLGALYAAFPQPLASLDGLVQYARHGEHDSAVAQAMDMDLTEGYVFGKSSGPLTLWRTFQALRAEGSTDPGQAEGVLASNMAELQAELAGPTPVLLGWLGLGLLAGCVSSLLQPGQRRLAWAWLAVLGVAAAVAPSIWVHLNTRFLLPLFWLLALPLVAPLALVSRQGPTWLRLLPLAAWGAVLLPGSAWRFAPERFNPVDVRAPDGATWFHYQLSTRPELQPLHVCADLFSTMFALDALPGQAGPGGFDNRKVWDLPSPGPEHFLLVREDPMLAAQAGDGLALPCDVAGRPQLDSWALGPSPIRLFGPVAAPVP